MQSHIYQFSLGSETFAHGAYQTQKFNNPELRAPSVKGMIRWWHEVLGYSKSDAARIFGTVASRDTGPTNQASVVAIRIEPLGSPQKQTKEFMPHKGFNGGEKKAILPNTRYELTLKLRRDGLSPELESQLTRATKAWLLLGAIGQRSNRGSGSIIWDEAPTTEKDYELEASKLLDHSKVRFAFLKREFRSSMEARDMAGRFPKHNPDDFRNPSTVPGAVFGSAGKTRKPSSLKLKTIPFQDTYKLLALWTPIEPREDNFQNLSMAFHDMHKFESKRELAALLEDVLDKFKP